jgi:hypothetical protein
MRGHITIHWSRRGGRPPYRGQSFALAAPRLSSGVRATTEACSSFLANRSAEPMTQLRICTTRSLTIGRIDAPLSHR